MKIESERFFRMGKKCYGIITDDPAVVCLHIGTAIGLYGFWSSDHLVLRSCALVSGVAGIVFNLTRKPQKLWVPVVWSLAFMGANTININKLMLERSNVELTDEQENIYVEHFLITGIRPRQFKRIYDGSTYRIHDCGTKLAEQGKLDTKKKVLLLLKGGLDVQVDGETIAELNCKVPASFVGEVGLLEAEKKIDARDNVNLVRKTLKHTHQHVIDNVSPILNQDIVTLNSATITVKSDVAHVLEWDRNFFLEILREHGELSSKLRALLLSTVLNKLRNSASESSKKTYAALVKACLSMGEINTLEKRALQLFRKEHNIDREFHLSCIQECGWTYEEYADGIKHDNNLHQHDSVLVSLQKLFKLSSGN